MKALCKIYNNPENPCKMNDLLGKYHFLKLTQEEVENQNRLITTKVTDMNFQIFSYPPIQGKFTHEFKQAVRDEIVYFLYTLFQKMLKRKV